MVFIKQIIYDLYNTVEALLKQFVRKYTVWFVISSYVYDDTIYFVKTDKIVNLRFYCYTKYFVLYPDTIIQT